MRTQMRQGDVFLAPVDQLPDDARPVEDSQVPGRVVVAHGEATGHHHSLDARWTIMFESAHGLFLRIMEADQLRHQEHGPLLTDPGIYRVVHQRVYSPEAIRLVAD